MSVSLHYEIERFKELTGEDAWYVPLGEIRRYLKGYEHGRKGGVGRVLEIIHRYRQYEPLSADRIDDMIREVARLWEDAEGKV